MTIAEWLHLAFISDFWWLPVGGFIVGGASVIYTVYDIFFHARQR